LEEDVLGFNFLSEGEIERGGCGFIWVENIGRFK
jgi:hypothetical protein